MSDAWTMVSLENQCQIRLGEMLGSDHGPDVLVSTGDSVQYLETQRERQSCTPYSVKMYLRIVYGTLGSTGTGPGTVRVLNQNSRFSIY